MWLVNLRRVSTSDRLSLGSDADLDVEFIGRRLQTIKFVLPNRSFTRPLGVCGLCRRGISGSEDETTMRSKTIVVISCRDLDEIASHP